MGGNFIHGNDDYGTRITRLLNTERFENHHITNERAHSTNLPCISDYGFGLFLDLTNIKCREAMQFIALCQQHLQTSAYQVVAIFHIRIHHA